MRIPVLMIASVSLFIITGCQPNQPKPKTNISEDSSISSNDQYQNESDLHLLQDIRENLAQDRSLALASEQIIITVQNGNISLYGLVETERDKVALENKIQQLSKSGKINNQIQVNSNASDLTENFELNILEEELETPDPVVPEPTSQVDDRTLDLRIRDALQNNPSLATSAKNVTIDVRSGNVILKGTVESPQRREAIGSAVQQVKGVREVDNQIHVRATSQNAYRRSQIAALDVPQLDPPITQPHASQQQIDADKAIDQRVRLVLRNDAKLANISQNVNILVRNGNVILTGWVNRPEEKIAIGNRVKQLSEIKSLDNQLKIYPVGKTGLSGQVQSPSNY